MNNVGGALKVITLATRFSTGGAQLNSNLVADQLRIRGFETESWFLMDAGGMDVFPDTPTHVFGPQLRNPIAILSLFLALCKRLKEVKADCVVGFHPLANILGALASLFVGTKFIGTQRNPSESQSLLTRLLEKLVGSTNLYAANIAVSHAVASSYQSYPRTYKSKMFVVHNGLPLMFRSELSRAELRTKLNLDKEAFICGFLGRIAEQKNPFFLIDILASDESIQVALAGDGPLREGLVSAARDRGVLDRLHLVGTVHSAGICEFYQAVDVFLLPSLFEGFGRTLVEAMEVGLPIIANDIPVVQEVLGDAGFREELKASNWVRVINQLKSDPELYSRASRSSMERRGQFSINKMIDGYEEAISNDLR